MTPSSPSATPRVWFITGCSSGFGASLASCALEQGDQVIATARKLEDLAWLAAHPSCRAFELDVTKAAQVRKVVAQAHAVWGRLDVIVNNAGAGLLAALEDCTDQVIEDCMEVNFRGPLEVMRAAAPLLRAQGSGHVINISAAAAISNYPGFAIYGAAKAALEAASESYLAELAPSGVKVTLVQPGPFRTRFIGSASRAETVSAAYDATVGKFATLLSRMDGRQPGDPDKAARAIVRLVNDGQAPLRLVLGAYAQKKARDTAQARLRELETFQSYGSGTEYSA